MLPKMVTNDGNKNGNMLPKMVTVIATCYQKWYQMKIKWQHITKLGTKWLHVTKMVTKL